MKIYFYIFFIFVSLATMAQRPEPPELINVSFDDLSNFDRYIYWNPSPSPDVAGYVVKMEIAGLWNPIADVGLNLFYVHNQTDPYSDSYRVAAYNSAHEEGLMSDPPHTSMYLFPYFDPNIDYCNKQTRLIWSAYEGWTSVKEYNIYSATNSGAWILIGTVNGSLTQFNHQNINYNSLYSYYIEAVSVDGVRANSNTTSVFTTAQDIPRYVRAEQASVSGNSISLTFSIDDKAISKGYELQRSVNFFGPYSPIATYGGTSVSPLTVSDNIEDASSDIFYYRLGVLDVCGNVTLLSNVASNIVLELTDDNKLETSLSWNEYSDWNPELSNNGVRVYHIYRQFDQNPSVLIDTIGPAYVNYYDDFSDEIESARENQVMLSGNVCYYIEAFEDTTIDTLGFEGISRSNLVCKTLEPVIYMPTAIFLNSKEAQNRIFLPLVTFATKDYKFMVFDKYGENIFETDNIYEGWDGKAKGKEEVPIGSYKWIIKFTTSDDKKFSRLGNITVIK